MENDVRTGGRWIQIFALIGFLNVLLFFLMQNTWLVFVGMSIPGNLTGTLEKFMWAPGTYLGIFLSLLFSGWLMVLGKQASEGNARAYTLALGIFAVDALLFLISGRFMEFLVHLVVLYFIWKGSKAVAQSA